jgi:ribosomal protein S8
MNQENIEFIAKITNQILQDIFFIVGTVVTTLTYINARKTVLQPIKTEVFKLQVTEFSSILNVLNTKNILEIEKIFDEILFINSCLLFDDYTELFFDVELDRNKRPYSNKQSITPIQVFSLKEMEEYNHYNTMYNRYLDNKKDKLKTNSEIFDQKSKLDLWMKYKYKKLGFFRIFYGESKK